MDFPPPKKKITKIVSLCQYVGGSLFWDTVTTTLPSQFAPTRSG